MSKQIVASMAGVLMSVAVEPGAAFKVGDTVAMLESMKMEIGIIADGSGTVQAIIAQPGDVVDEGTVIFTYV